MRSFAQLFSGGSDCYTSIRYVPGSNRDGDKLEAQVQTIHEEPTAEVYDAHVAGRQSIGIVPIREDGTVSFVVVDCDSYSIQESYEVAAHVWRTQGNQFIPCLSKSNGLHLYAFFADPVPAKYARQYAATWAKRFGIAKAEIFPKQDELRGDELGNAINLPYFGEHRPAIDADGTTIELEEFLEMAENRLLPAPPPEPKKSRKKTKSIWEQGPPCIQALIENAPVEDQRDLKMYQMLTFAMKVGDGDPQAAKNLLAEWNADYFRPRLRDDEINNKIKQGSKGRYGYQCKADWAVELCDSEECGKRKYGIKSAGEHSGFTDQEAEIEEIIEMYGNTGAPQYKVKIYGKHVFFESIEELVARETFINRVCLAANKDLVWAGKADKFAPFMRRQLVEKRVVDERSHNEFTTLKGIVLNKFKSYVRDRVNKDHANAANSDGRVRLEGSKLWVPVAEVLEQMDKIKIMLNRKIDRRHIDTVLAEFGCRIDSHPDDGNIYYVYEGELWFPVESEYAANQPYS